MLEPFIGQLELYPYNFAPEGWLPCDGRSLPIRENEALFSLLGITYGGDGYTVFNLPDLRGRVPIGQGSAPGQGRTYDIGRTGGQAQVTLTVANLPGHTHTLATADSSTTNSPSGNFLGPLTTADGTPANAYDSTPEASLAPGVIANTGGGQPHENMPPYLALQWCIATIGEYPTRNDW
ncbi:MAG: phage tail protein [Limnothrix sp. CACIAM 69d]|nr:MAG: phage tail protein [Limnothrix sp. CACIAM 69d]